MIEIVTVLGKEKLFLKYAQAYMLDGKNRITIEDASTLRVQPHGGKLSPLVIEGYYPIIERNNFLKMRTYFTQSFEPFYPVIPRMEQFIINQAVGGSENDAVIPDTVGNIPYRGILEEFKYNMKVDDSSHMLIGYFIKFKVYPYTTTEHRIKQVYFLK